MLIKISVTNFFSIKEQITVDFTAARINTSGARELSDNIFTVGKGTFLKSIGIFGPNASGKSSIFKAITFCHRLVIFSHINNDVSPFNYEPFKFDGFEKKPSEFSISFICDKIEYEYSFSLNKSGIISESLYYYPGKKRARIFTRNEEKDNTKNEIYSFGDGHFVRPYDVAESTGCKTLFISRAAQMNRELAKKIHKYFYTELYVGIPKVPDTYVETKFNRYKPILLEALKMADSDIVDIEIKKERVTFPAPEAYLTIGKNVISSIPTVESDVVIRFLTIHKRSPDVRFDLVSEESSGTVHLFYLLIILLDVCRKGKTLIVDEFDFSFHTEITDFILKMVHASDNAQILFTSHNTNLIDVKKFRRDQICFTNKKEDGSTDFYSLYDFKDFRENMDAEKGYLQGRFDAVPYTAASIETIKKLFGMQHEGEKQNTD